MMSLSGKEYEKMTKRASPPSPKLMNLLKAFLIGGLICAIGEGFSMLYESLGADEKTVSSLVPCTLVVIAAVLTALGVFDRPSCGRRYTRADNRLCECSRFARDGVSERGKDSRHGRKYV